MSDELEKQFAEEEKHRQTIEELQRVREQLLECTQELAEFVEEARKFGSVVESLRLKVEEARSMQKQYYEKLLKLTSQSVVAEVKE